MEIFIYMHASSFIAVFQTCSHFYRAAWNADAV